jgi:hypothetical protein
MSELIGAGLPALFFVALIALLVGAFKSVQKSRFWAARYRAATPSERRRLDERMESDSDLESHMRPLAWWEILVAAAITACMMAWMAHV